MARKASAPDTSFNFGANTTRRTNSQRGVPKTTKAAKRQAARYIGK